MIQTLLNIPVVPQMFGMTVIDESHHIPSCTFSKILFKVNAKYVVGLTATPNRKDGLTNVLHWHVGETLYEEMPDRREQTTTLVEVYYYVTSRVSYKIDPRNYADMITKLCNDEERTEVIIEAIQEQLSLDPHRERRMLILTERKSHARTIANLLQDIYGKDRSCGLLLGGMKKETLEGEMEKDLLVATYNLMSEGISIPKLNSILFASPKRDVVQALGRIFRKIHKDVNPLIIDIADSILRGQLKGRLTIYEKELNGNIKIRHHHEGDRKQRSSCKDEVVEEVESGTPVCSAHELLFSD